MKKLRPDALAAVLCLLIALALPALALNTGEDKGLSYEALEIYDPDTDKISVMNLEEYTSHVMMPVVLQMGREDKLPADALEALAIVMRTRAMLYLSTGCKGDFCLCEGHSLLYRKEVGENVKTAVKETAGLVLTYEGALAPAFLHHSSHLVTQSAYNGLGREISCLVSVSSPEIAPVYGIFVSREEFEMSMQIKLGFKDYEFSDTLERELDSSGRVKSIKSTKYFTDGESFAKAFGLPGTHILLEKKEDGYMITCHGRGSGLGMSVCGALEMARSGKDYTEILDHYYKGCKVLPVYKIIK